jgi:hypothetical protein
MQPIETVMLSVPRICPHRTLRLNGYRQQVNFPPRINYSPVFSIVSITANPIPEAAISSTTDNK